MITKREKQKRGFTMIELLAVLVILGIIMVIAVPSVVSYLQGARNDYYNQLEESVKTVGQEYFSDHRSLMPRENGQIFSVDIQDLITEGYTTEILDSDGNDTCTGNVYVKRLATADFEYHACIQCGKTDAEGNQEYISTDAFCTGGNQGGTPDGVCDKPKDDPTDDCFMIQVPNDIKVPQCTTVEDSARSQGISLEGIVLNNGEDIGDRVPADTTGVDYKKYGNYKIYYTYKQVLNPAGDKYNTNVTVYDDKAPSEPVITMHTDSTSGQVYNCTSASNCNWTGKDVYITVTATDESDCGTEGSGIKEFQYRYGNSSWSSVQATKNGNVYTATITRKSTFEGTFDVKAVDNAMETGASKNNESGTTRAYLMVDKTPPSCTSSGGKTSWTTDKITLKGTCSDAQSGCESNVQKIYDSDYNSTKESPGTVSDKVGNTTVCPANQTVKIDRTAPAVSISNKPGTKLSGYTYYQSYKATATATDSGVGQIKMLYCKSTSSNTATQCAPSTNIANFGGSYTFTYGSAKNYQRYCVLAKDGLGNTSKVYCSTSAHVDSTKPSATGGSFSLNSARTQGTMSVSGSDSESGVHHTEYNSGSGWTKSNTFSAACGKTYTTYGRVVNNAGLASDQRKLGSAYTKACCTPPSGSCNSSGATNTCNGVTKTCRCTTYDKARYWSANGGTYMGFSNGAFYTSAYCGSNGDTYNAGGADPNYSGCWSNVAEASGATLNDYCSNTQYVPQHSFTCHVETGQNCSWQ